MNLPKELSTKNTKGTKYKALFCVFRAFRGHIKFYLGYSFVEITLLLCLIVPFKLM
jgi:hypothetical protein